MNNFKRTTTTLCHLLILAAMGALIYSNALTASFQFDDKINIVNNPLIRDIRNFWPPSGARWFGFLTFSLNYLAGGLNPFGYHLVNIFIHILTAFSVYFFVLLTFRTPYFNQYQNRVRSGQWFALSCSLLFITHPIQTQAVTYIVQRFASLATLVFILSLNSYILARLQTTKGASAPSTGTFRFFRSRILLYSSAVFFALLSLKTKENAYTLPVIAILYDVMFLSSLSSAVAAVRKQWRIIVAAAALVLCFLVFLINRHGLLALADTFKATNEISRYDYLVTQFRVIITYLRLLFLPIGQTVDHYYKVYRTIFSPEIIISLTVLTLLVYLAVYLYQVSRIRYPYLRLVSFGIFFFFVTLSIESSIIPIIDVMFEHRLYLPSIGALIAVAAIFVHVMEKLGLTLRQMNIAGAGILSIVIIVFSCASYERNRVWKDELSLWSDAIAKKPNNPRAYNMVGSYYQNNFRIYDAIYYFRKALEVDSSYAEARSNLGIAYIQTGKIDEGLHELAITLKANRFDEIDTGILYFNIGKGLNQKGLPDQAIENLNRALRYIPNEAAVYYNLGEAFQKKNLPGESKANFNKAHELDPSRY